MVRIKCLVVTYGLIVIVLERCCLIRGENKTVPANILETLSLFKQIGAEKRLIKDLLEDYEKLSRPRLTISQPVTVLTDLIIIQFTELDGKRQVLNSNAWLRLSWKDSYLRWNSTEYKVPQVMVPVKKLWMPDLVIENSASSLFGFLSADPLAVIKPDGSVYVVFGDHVSTLCDLDLTYYPFDEQNCTIKISNWLSDDSLVQTRNQFTNLDFKSYRESVQWSVKNSKVSFTLTRSTLKNLNFPAVEYSIELRRKPFYHVMYMILPSFILSLIALLMFWLPPESGEKVSLGITVFLAFSVLMFSLSDDLPESSDTFPILGIYLVFVMNITAVWLVLTIAILNVHNTTFPSKPARQIKCVINILSKGLCMKIQSIDHRQCNDTDCLHDRLEAIKNDWILIGRVLDRLCLFLFSVINVAAFVLLMSFCPISTLPHPKTFPREESEWRIYN